MASFVEQATLVVKDESTAQINKINAALKKLFATANSLKSIKIDIKVNDKGLQQAISNLNKLKSAMSGMKSTPVTIKANTAGLAAAQKQLTALRAQAAKPITGPRIAPAKGMPWGYAPAAPGRQPRGGGRGAAPPRGPAEEGAGSRGGRGAIGTYLRSISEGAIREAGRAALRYGYRSTVAGANDAAIGDAMLKLQQLPPKQMKAAQDAIRQIGEAQAKQPGGTLYNPAQRQKLFSEVLGVTTGDVPSAKVLTPFVEELTRTSVLLGKSFQDAEQDAIGYAKAVQQTGRGYYQRDVVDPTTGEVHRKGTVDPSKMKGMFDYFQKIQPEIGKEMTGDFANRMVKYLGKEKYSISDRGLGAVLLMGEEYGTKAAVGYRQAVKQLGGYQVDKPQKAFQKEYGLDKNKEFQQLLQTDMPKAVSQFIAPIAKKLGLDMNIAEDANNLAKKLVSNSSAQESLGAALYRNAEVQAQLDRAEARDPEKFRQDTKDNLRTTMIGLDNAIQGVGGQAIQALAPLVTPQLQALTGAIGKTSEHLKAGEYGAAAWEVTKGAAAAGKVGAAAMIMKPLITETLSAMAPMMALKAATSGDPGVQAMGHAAAALTAAAGDLSGAAGALKGTPGMPGAADAPWKKLARTLPGISTALMAYDMAEQARGNLPFLDKDTPEGKQAIKISEAQDALKKAIEAQSAYDAETRTKQKTDAVKQQKAVLADAVRIATIAALDAVHGAGPKPGDAAAPGNVKKSLDERVRAEQELTEAEQERVKTVKALQAGELEGPDARAKIAEIDAQIAAKKQELKVASETAAAAKKFEEQQAKDAAKKPPPPPGTFVDPTLKPQPIPGAKPLMEVKPDKVAITNPDSVEVSSAGKIPPEPDTALQGTSASGGRKKTADGTPVPVTIVGGDPSLKPPPPGVQPEPGAAAAPTDIAAQLTAAAAGIGAAIAAPVIAAGPAIGAGITAPLEGAASTFAAAFGQVGAQMSAAGASLAAAGSQAAAAISGGAAAAGSAYGSAAAAKISAAVANVTISVQHSGSVGGNADKGTNVAK